MYRFIFGAAGTGKTTYIYNWITEEAVRHTDKKYYLFVPEQNTLKAQQELIRHSSRHGMLNLDVLSFNLLAYRVFEELGVELPEILNEMSKSLFLRKACQEVKDELKVYQSKLGASGFIHQIKSVISELYQYNIGRDRLKDISEAELNPLLKAKLEDIALISDAFLRLKEDKAMIAEELPVILLKQLAHSDLIKDAVIAFDGFTGFTPIQLELLAHIMSDAAETVFSVTIPSDAKPYSRESSSTAVADLWWLSRETVARLCMLGEKNGLVKGDDISFSKVYIKPERLLLNAPNPEEEIKRITANIVRRTRGDEKSSIRYRNIAVAVTEPQVYREIIKRNFAEAGLPFFIDDTSDGFGNVAIELIRCVLSIIRDGYRYDDVLRYAKNALILNTGGDEQVYSANVDMADIFDNYVRAKGIRGRRAFEREWRSTYRGAEALELSALNKYRDELMQPVFRLHDSLVAAGNISERIDSLKAFISDLKLEERNSAFTGFLSEMGYIRESEENAEFYSMLEELLESINVLLGTERLSIEEFAEIFEAGAADLKAGMLPHTIDMIVVGDLKRSRFDDIAALYIVGANDGYLPQVVSGGGIFTDQERAALRAADLELAPLDKEDICIQNYYIYLLMNKPAGAITMSWSSTDRDGKAMKASSIVQSLKNSEEWRRMEEPELEDMIYSKDEALLYFSRLTSDKQNGREHSRAMYSYLKEEPDSALRADRILRASLFKHDEDRISEPEARLLYGNRLYGSVTRIESYERCAYAHFLTYGLRLLERQQFDIEAFDIGNLYHQAIEQVFRELAISNRLIQEVEQAELDQLSDMAVDRITAEYNDQIMQSTARNIYISRMVKKITRRTLWAVREQLTMGNFKTFGCEVPFMLKEDNLELRGRIDRIDISEGPSKIYVKVIDYKSGRTSFDLSLVYQGLQLQLVTYMDIAVKETEKRMLSDSKEGKSTVPGGMFYYRVTNPMLDYKNLKPQYSVEEQLLDEFTPSGLANADPEALTSFNKVTGTDVKMLTGSKLVDDTGFSYLVKHTENIIKNDTGRILSGDINKRPYMTSDRTGCEYCSYHSICGFDERMEGFDYRRIYKLDDNEIWSRLEKEYGEPKQEDTEEQDLRDEMD